MSLFRRRLLMTIQSVSEFLKSYKIFGNTIQDGTPTPTNPVEVQTVGDKTANNIDYTNYTEERWLNLFDTYMYHLILKPNTAYTLSSNVSISVSQGYSSCLYFNGDSTANAVKLGKNSTQTTGADGSIYIAIVKGREGTESLIDGTYYMMLTEGDTASDYVPYGYKISITANGKNLNYQNLRGFYSSWGTYVEDNKYVISLANVVAGQTYTISQRNASTVRMTRYGQMNTEDNTYISTVVTGVDASTYTITSTFTGVLGMSWRLLSTTEFEPEDVQIEIGSIATDYVPYIEPVTETIYLDKPLYKIGEYADYIDFENQRVVRKINSRVCTGVENWVHMTNFVYTEGNPSDIASTKPDVTGTDKLFCDRFLASTANVAYGNTIRNRGSNLRGIVCYPQQSLITNLTTWKNWLASNPTTVWYVRNTEITENIALPQIKNGYSYSIGTTVQPSSMSIKRKSAEEILW